jgi:hypothetical protein
MAKDLTVAEAGKLGGKAGKGEAKRRGDADYYRANAIKAHEARRKNKEKKESDTA